MAAPLTFRELLRQFPYRERISGWCPTNPPGVERAFRVGFAIGASRGAKGDLGAGAGLVERLHARRGDIYHGELNTGFNRWSDRRAAVLRGAMQGALAAVRARAEGVRKGIRPWLEALRTWAAEGPIRLDWDSACPPDAPEPDGPPLGRDGVPRRLWGEVFGTWGALEDGAAVPSAPANGHRASAARTEINATLSTSANSNAASNPSVDDNATSTTWAKDHPALAAPARVRGPFIKTQAEYEKLRATELARLRAQIRAHNGEFTDLEVLAEYPDDVQAVWREELAARAARRPGPVTVLLADVSPELVRWLWPGRIALGKLTLLCGDPGLGKSFVTLDLAARVSSGAPWPDLPLLPNQPGSVVLLSAEDDLADTIRPRLDAAKADASRIIAIQAVRRVAITGQTQEDYFDLTDDLPALETAIGRMPSCRLVIIDPLTAYLGKTDSHKNAEVRAVLARLFELAARHKVAVLAVTHLNKASTLPAIYRAMGSLAFVAAARAVWAVVRDENDHTGRRRLFVPIKNNLGADETGLAYALEPAGGTARVVWESGEVNMRADDALGGGRKPVVRDDATQFVIDTLTANGGDMPSDELWAAAKSEGISKMTLRRAKEATVESYKEKGRDGRWRCKLKGVQQDAQDTPLDQIRTT